MKSLRAKSENKYRLIDRRTNKTILNRRTDETSCFMKIIFCVKRLNLKTKFDPKIRLFMRYFLSFCTEHKKYWVFSRKLANAHKLWRCTCNFLSHFLLAIPNIFFVGGAYVPGSKIEFRKQTLPIFLIFMART
jgi:hypothetical protein